MKEEIIGAFKDEIRCLREEVQGNIDIIGLTKTTAAQNETTLSYHNVLGLYFLAVVFVTNILLYLYYYWTFEFGPWQLLVEV